MTTCANCGVRNVPDATFCRSCHHFLAWADPGGSSPPAPDPVRSPRRDPAPPVIETAPAAATTAAETAPVIETAPAADVAPVALPRVVEEHRAAAPVDPVQGALDTVDSGRRLALARGREDLAEHLQHTRVQIVDRVLSVAVVGEFKRGKSTLINALLQTAVCPVDADIVTAVPTVIRYGERATAVAHLEPTEDDPEPIPVDVPIDELGSFVSEAGNPGNRRRLRTVEVLLPHLMLRSGLCLVDTPGVGGLDSAHGVITLSALAQAQGMIFLTDASQELTAAELEFLQSAVARCPEATFVVTKTDLYREWRRIVELDEGHLRRAGVDIPILAVSSFLRLGAAENPDLLIESGFPALVDFLLGTVVSSGAAKAVDTAEAEVEFITAQLEDGLRAEQAVLERPDEAQHVVARLDEAREKTQLLVAPTATWQQMLSDGIQDLVAEVEFDLQERLRTVLRDVETIIDEGDPKHSWPDIEVWLRRQVVGAAVANYDRMDELARQLAANVAGAFDLVAGQVTSASSVTVSDSITGVRIATATSLENPGGRVASMLIAGRTATLVPMILVGTLGHLLLPVIAPLALILAGGIGQKVIRDERRRQVAYRRQQAKAAARKYIDEVAFMVSKDSRDALRGTQRALRDDFQARAASLQRSSETALHAARSAIALDPAERDVRAAHLARETADVVELRSRRRPQDRSPAVAHG